MRFHVSTDGTRPDDRLAPTTPLPYRRFGPSISFAGCSSEEPGTISRTFAASLSGGEDEVVEGADPRHVEAAVGAVPVEEYCLQAGGLRGEDVLR